MSTDVVADLHVHTTASDGTATLQAVIEEATDRDLEAIAITDHDRVHPDLDEPWANIGGLTVIRGIEIKVERSSGERIDLLAYGVRETPAVDALVERIQDDRVARARRMRACLEDRLDVELPLEVEPGVGRPHLARAVADHPALSMSEQDVFDDLIGDGRPCFVARNVPTCSEARDVLDAAASIIAVAHPLRYRDVEDAIACARELGAIERWYAYETSVDHTAIQDAVDRHDLLPTGGSDAHDGRVGGVGLDSSAFRRFTAALYGRS